MPPRSRLDRARPLARLVLVGFVLGWILGPYWLRSTVPLWAVFLLALGLELQFFVGGLRGGGARSPERAPQEADRERWGYSADPEQELVLVRAGGELVWLPYAGESEEELEALAAAALDEEHGDEGELVPARPSPERAERSPVLRRALGGLGFLAVVGLLLWYAQTRTGWEALDRETRAEAGALFSREAASIAGKPVTIRCDESGDHVGAVQHSDGVAVVGGDLAYLAPERCLDLYRLAFRGEVRSSQTGRALAVLAHEAWHLRGVRDEGTTECYALQSAVELGERLGLEPGVAQRLARQQLAENALRRGRGAEYRIPASCRDGGALDLAPERDRFP